MTHHICGIRYTVFTFITAIFPLSNYSRRAFLPLTIPHVNTLQHHVSVVMNLATPCQSARAVLHNRLVTSNYTSVVKKKISDLWFKILTSRSKTNPLKALSLGLHTSAGGCETSPVCLSLLEVPPIFARLLRSIFKSLTLSRKKQ